MKFTHQRKCLITIILMFTFQISFADFRLANVFGDNMVLQRNKEIPVWGFGDKGEKITISFNGQSLTVKVKQGKWMVKFPAMKAGGPYEMILKGKKVTKTIKNILIGDVWICSGQSNMEWVLQATNNAEEEIANANYPQIRHLKVPRVISTLQKEDIEAADWQICSPETAGNFTAVGYYFAKALRGSTNVPIGLLNTTWGGTNVETWTSPEAIGEIPEFKSKVEELKVADLEKMAALRKEKLIANIGNIPDKDPGLVDGKAIWAESDFDDSSWKKMELPGLWENQGLADLDGIVWFRRTFELTEEQVQTGIKISLGPVDDNEMTWINGNQVGKTEGYNIKREYEAQPDQLKAGENTIVIRVDDTGGGGGIYGDQEVLFVSANGKKISLAGDWKYKVGEASINASLSPNSMPSLLYNAMLAPVVPYAMTGVIWYQGESNAGRAYTYRTLFPLMIKDWRNKWQAGDFPFLFVQLANFMAPKSDPGESAWAELREAQSMTLSLPNTGQAVIIDIGEANDIHPRNKKDVGYRLSLAARKIAYNEDIVFSGPVYQSHSVENGKVRIKFEHVGGGLLVKDKYGYINGFELAGEDKKFYFAKAKLEGNEVIVWTDEVNSPIAIRYGWAENPDDLNLYNKENLPASPFRTDEWPGITQP
ncbi:sialate O-acetylesterase [Flexithrix dorotheae]|uniref:sialate O-acetylesterase n=1 Tax=Flexithrix dorotheae TaxID=70993 RepID=UPI0003697B39|nr:sialate O-acetylesterase [Flexithrix dorotheae]